MINLADPQWIIALSSVIGGFVIFTIWLIRLEGKQRENAKDLARFEAEITSLKSKFDMYVEKIFDKLSSIEISLAKLDSKFNNTRVKK
jgi:hypothetical protein